MRINGINCLQHNVGIWAKFLRSLQNFFYIIRAYVQGVTFEPFQQSVACVAADSTVVNCLSCGLRKGIKQLIAIEYFRN